MVDPGFAVHQQVFLIKLYIIFRLFEHAVTSIYGVMHTMNSHVSRCGIRQGP